MGIKWELAEFQMMNYLPSQKVPQFPKKGSRRVAQQGQIDAQGKALLECSIEIVWVFCDERV